MKHFFLFLISLYKMVLTTVIKGLFGISNACRFSPTCSEYTKRSINTYGILKGMKLSLSRLLSCQTIFSL